MPFQYLVKADRDVYSGVLITLTEPHFFDRRAVLECGRSKACKCGMIHLAPRLELFTRLGTGLFRVALAGLYRGFSSSVTPATTRRTQGGVGAYHADPSVSTPTLMKVVAYQSRIKIWTELSRLVFITVSHTDPSGPPTTGRMLISFALMLMIPGE